MFSLCPVCLRRLPAVKVPGEKGQVFLQKRCPDHGNFQSLLWNGRMDFTEWTAGLEGAQEGDGEPPCPGQCGLCPEHLQDTCCTLLEVTKRCNLHCRYCFAESSQTKGDPSLEALQSAIQALTRPGKTFLQLSGGEPTLRKDLPEIIAYAKGAGCCYVQLNSNGLRLAEDRNYVKTLADSGLSFVFMQFDGTDDAIYESLRGRPLFEAKQRAIENCAAHRLGVTLVPTLVPGINTQAIGDILRFAFKASPAVRGVHFQPVSHFGRIPCHPGDEHRFTLDELLFEIEAQTGGLIPAKHLLPSRCDHPLCGFHGDFVIDGTGKPVPLSKKATTCCCNAAPAEKSREFVARRWLRPKLAEKAPSCCGELTNMDYFLDRVQSHGFTVTAMAFQDAGNIDLDRLRRCSLHVYDQERHVPFCAYYLSALPSETRP